MTIGRITSLVSVAVLVLAVNVAASVLYMVVYGHVIDPGHDATMETASWKKLTPAKNRRMA